MATPYYDMPASQYIEKCLQTSLHPTDYTPLTEMGWGSKDSGVYVHMHDTKHSLYMDVAVVCYEDGDLSSYIEPWIGESDVNGDWLDAFLCYREASDWVCEQAVKYAQTLSYFAQKEDGTWVFDKNGHAEDLI